VSAWNALTRTAESQDRGYESHNDRARTTIPGETQTITSLNSYKNGNRSNNNISRSARFQWLIAWLRRHLAAQHFTSGNSREGITRTDRQPSAQRGVTQKLQVLQFPSTGLLFMGIPWSVMLPLSVLCTCNSGSEGIRYSYICRDFEVNFGIRRSSIS